MTATSSEPISTSDLSIAGVSEAVVYRYFETLNAGDFQSTAALFAAGGVLYPPFDPPLSGSEAIAAYLEVEATGMQFHPKQGAAESVDAEATEVKVTGKVQTPWFGVNVSWLFVLNAQSQLQSVRIRLLASPQELLSFKR